MKVLVYMGSFNLLEKSGIGRSMLHQKLILEREGLHADEPIDEPDIVHINTVMPDSVLFAFKSKLQKKKIVYYGHSTMEDFKNSFFASNLLAPLFKQWIKFCYNLGDVIVTPTNYSKNILDTYGLKKNVYPLSNGIDTEFFSPKKVDKSAFCKKYGIAEDEKIVISVGHLIERKGILDFIELARRMPHVKFIWFGYTNTSLIPRTIKDAIASAPKNLIFAGYVTKEELRDAYCIADLFAFMSHEETEGIVVLEALACKIPMIVRSIPVYEDWLEDNKNVYKAKSLESFHIKTRAILSKAIPSLTEEGRKVAHSRSISAVGQKLKDIYFKELV